MGIYIAFSIACSVLALVYLNRGQGSKRLFPSIGAVLVFLLFMWAISLEQGYGVRAAVNAGGASAVCGTIMYWLVLLEQKLWHGGAVGKTVALIAFVCTFYISVPIWALGTVVRAVFHEQFDAADATVEAEKKERAWRISEKARRRQEREEEILRELHSDDDLCTYFSGIYQRMGYASIVERVGDDGPLRMFLEKDGHTFSFVAILRSDVLGAEEVEWAASFRGTAEKAGLVTSGTFNAKAIRKAEELHVALVDRPNLPKFEQMARREEQKRAFGI